MGSPINTIQPNYLSLLSDISQPPAQAADAPMGFFSQFMNEAVASTTPVASDPSIANAATIPVVAQTAAPKTIHVQIDTNPGALSGRAIAPEGSVETGQWAILPDGSYFSNSDVNANGVATLHAPPAGWQGTGTGETLTSLEALLGAVS